LIVTEFRVSTFHTGSRFVRRTLSHNTGSNTTAIQRKQANKPNTATSRCLFQDNKLTNTTADIKTTKTGETPSRPDGPYELAGCQNRMLKYASGTSVNNATLKTLDGVEVAIMSREPNVQSSGTRDQNA
jgi:hypothetical protein